MNFVHVGLRHCARTTSQPAETTGCFRAAGQPGRARDLQVESSEDDVNRSRPAHGFTMIEMAIVVAIIGVVTAIAMVSLSRSRPRASLAGAAADLQALLHGARQQALASGQDVLVLVFPNQATPGGAKGRIAVILDGDHFLLDPAQTDFNLDGVKSAQVGVGPNSELLTTLDLPAGVEIGPAQGLGAAFKLVAPYAGIPVDADCTFCEGDDAKRRGAVLFDSRGRARFYPKVGPPLAVDGGSLSLTAPALQDAVGAGATRTLAVGASTGNIKAINGGG